MAHHTIRARMTTFLLSAALVAIVVTRPSVAQAHQLDDLHARQHNRMVRVHKRSPAKVPDVGCLGGPCLSSATAASPTNDPNPGQQTPSSSSTTPSSIVPPTSASSTPNLIGDFTSLVGGLGGSSSSAISTPVLNATSSTLPTSSSSSSSTTTTSSSSSTSVTTSTSSTSDIQSTHTVFVSGTTSSPAPTQTTPAAISATHSLTVARKTIVVLVAIAGSIALTFFIWTGSANGIQTPTTDRDDPAEKVAHRRQGSTGSHGSFGTNDLNHGVQGSGVALARSASGRTILQDELPPHDFTPGPAHLISGAPGPSLNGGDPYGGYEPYDDGLAPHMGYSAQSAPGPGYGHQYRGY
ncbi:hypothetical protein BS47DRAFT_1363204 [Hydnum rufescens UP504]|uniref:Uncharacterized protein n=1 Tax=Hydnum rufescens UP504 TaxID=1448309 RepID=A0A9P6AUU7_9AGAM|nr:hypothetical protein BS47DRAFT_1363204 [Hydnum rufescens UP504]